MAADDAVFRAAESYQGLGWAVFPVKGKIPVTRNGVKDASTKPRLAAIWYSRYPERGVALATGEVSGVWALDLDGEEGKEAFVELQEEHGPIPKTVCSRTGSGWHLFWQMPDDGDVRNSASQVAPKVDVRGTGGYVVLPPSPHPSGRRYEWVDGRSPNDVSVAAAPDWLVDLVRAPQRSTAGAAVVLPEAIPESGGPFGGRDVTLFKLGCSLRAKGLSRDAILAALRIENRDRCVPPLDDATVKQKADQAANYEPGTIAPPTRNGHRMATRRPEVNGPDPGDGAALVEPVDFGVLESIGLEKQQPIDAVPTPWPAWNKACFGAGGAKGLARRWHVVIGAASGSGKSLAAMNLAAAALRNGDDVCLISLEMSRSENVTRLLAILTGERIKDLEHGDFRPKTWQRAAERFVEQPGRLTTNPRPIHSLDQVESVIVQQADQGVRVVIVDYLQLAWSRNAETLYQQITEVSHVIQGLAKDLNITTVGISQVNRRTSSGNEKLAKEGLMGGSSLENDAEQVVLIGKPERMYDGFSSDVRLDKNRHGPQREWKIRLDPKTLQMLEMTG